MRKLMNYLLLGVGMACLLAFCVYFVRGQLSRDDLAPVISMESDRITMSVWDDREGFLVGVTARDDVDGDVTPSLVVEGVSAVGRDGSVTVTYAAFDRAGNVGKAERTVIYSDYEGPKFALSSPLVFRMGGTVNLYRYVSASDPVDGDLSDHVKVSLESETADLSTEGIHPVTLRVTNSMGDTARLTVPVEVYSGGGHTATLSLTQYLVYVEKGSSFDPSAWVKSLWVDSRTVFADRFAEEGVSFEVTSHVDTAVPGTYTVDYTALCGGFTGASRLIVVVEE